MCEQLDVKLLSEGRQVRRHHAARGQVDLVTAGLHLVTEWHMTLSSLGEWTAAIDACRLPERQT